MPEFRSDSVTPADIVLNFKCELADAVTKGEPGHGWLMDWNMAVTLTLTVTNNGSGNANGTLTIPLTPGAVSPKLDIGTDTTAKKNDILYFNQKIKKLVESNPCDKYEKYVDRLPFRLHGDLKIRSWLDRVANAKFYAGADVHQLDHTVDFTIEKSLDPSIGWSMIPVGFRTLTANALFKFSNKNFNSLKMVLTKPPEDKKPIEVVIVQPKPKPLPPKQKKAIEDARAKVKRLEEALERKVSPPDPSFVGPVPKQSEEEIRKDLAEAERRLRRLTTPRAYRTAPSVDSSGLTAAERRALDDALGRSILQDFQGELRDLNIDR